MYCRKCGAELLEDSAFCSKCGTRVIEDIQQECETDFQSSIPDFGQSSENIIPDHQSQNEQSKKKKNNRIIVIGILICIFLIVSIPIAGHLIESHRKNDTPVNKNETESNKTDSTTIVKRQLNEVTGCPEIYDLQWWMYSNTVSSKIQIPHHLIPEHMEGNKKIEDSIEFDSDVEFPTLYGIPIDYIVFSFENHKLSWVTIYLPKSETNLTEVKNLYTKIYGYPTNIIENNITSWQGKYTRIDVYDTDEVLSNAGFGDLNAIAIVYAEWG